ncbi:carboxyl transferase domain-containing protein, partial [Vibrio sp. Vb0877]|uniref:carboxyl transferase domain-containing protein n=1 Tax=Vibrio sp. Vb0877 TaxID=2816073 RepID=UPI002413F373
MVKGATGQTIDNETLGGAITHNAISGVAHYRVADDHKCIDKIRSLVSALPPKITPRVSISQPSEPKADVESLYEIFPDDHRAP